MTIHFEERENEIHMTIEERLNFKMHPEFNNYMETVSEKNKNLVINIERLNNIDSAGLGMLFLAQKITSSKGKKLLIKKPRGQVKRIFEIADVARQIRVVDN